VAAVALCRGVTVRYGEVRALDRLSLEVQPGRITALVGPNGAGKTTALRLLAGLVPAGAGSVEVFGLDPWTSPVEVRRQLGFLPDRPALPSHLSADELLHLRLGLHGIRGERARSAMETLNRELGLGPLLPRWCSALSHGQAQRVALAAVLIHDPELILVDEPMTALDLEAQLLVRQALALRAARGAAVLITTHTVAHVAALAGHVVQLAEGRVRAERGGGDGVEELERWILGNSS